MNELTDYSRIFAITDEMHHAEQNPALDAKILEGKRKTLRGIGSPADIAQELCEDILAKGKKK